MKTSQTETPLVALQNKFKEIPKELGAMSTTSVEGLCTAVAVCPSQIPENKWTPLVWGKTGVPRIVDKSEVNYIRKLVLNYYKYLNAEIKRGNYPNDGHAEFKSNDWRDWFKGFGIGLSLDINAWKKINELDARSKYSLWFMTNLIKLQTSTEKTLETTKEICERQIFKQLPDLICSIAGYTQNREKGN